MKDTKALKTFGLIALLEGISYLLIFITMMLKRHDADTFGIYNKVVGWSHGVLFVLYSIYLLICWIKYRWSFGKSVLYFFLSFIPFGTFWVDKKVHEEMKALSGEPKTI